jgi:hypothetical protein
MSNIFISLNTNVFLSYLNIYILLKLRSIFLYHCKENEYSGNDLITDVRLFMVPLNIRIITVHRVPVIGIFDVCFLLGCINIKFGDSSLIRRNISPPSSVQLLLVSSLAYVRALRGYVPRALSRLHGVRDQKNILFTVSAVKTQNPTVSLKFAHLQKHSLLIYNNL